MKNISELQEKLGNDLDRISKSTLHSWQIKDIIDYIMSPECRILLIDLFGINESTIARRLFYAVDDCMTNNNVFEHQKRCAKQAKTIMDLLNFKEN